MLGGSLMQSEVIKGMVLTKDVEGAVDEVKDAKVAIFTCPIDASSTETKSTVLLQSAQELMNYNEGEEKMIHDVGSFSN